MRSSAPLAIACRLRGLAARFVADREGNILIMTGLIIIPLLLAVGFGLDYSHAMKMQTRLDADADAAALSAVSGTAIGQSSGVVSCVNTSGATQNSTDVTNQLMAVRSLQAFVAQIPGFSGSIGCPTQTANSATSDTEQLVVPAPAGSSLTGNITVTSTVSYLNATSLTGRKAKVVYQAQATDYFAGVYAVAGNNNAKSLAIGGNSTAVASQPPSLNFYVAMDMSPSMLLPTTSTGISNLQTNTEWAQYSGQGCDFACHSNNMQQWRSGVYVQDTVNVGTAASPVTVHDSIYLNAAGTDFYRVGCTNTRQNNVYSSANVLIGNFGKYGGMSTSATSCNDTTNAGSVTNPITLKYLPSAYVPNSANDKTSNYVTLSVQYPDTFWLAENFSSVNSGQSNIQLRIDAMTAASQSLLSTAYQYETQYAHASPPPIYKLQFYTFNLGSPTAIAAPFGTMTDVASTYSTTFPQMSSLAPLDCSSSTWTNCGGSNADTDYRAMLSGMQTNMPTSAGAGTQASPQNVLVIITDGMDDSSSNAGAMSSSEITQCNAIKANGTRIAILYTQYVPATINYTSDSTFTTYAGYVSSIQSQLQACASTNPDGSSMMVTVPTNGDISAALNALFIQAIQTAALVQ